MTIREQPMVVTELGGALKGLFMLPYCLGASYSKPNKFK